jgi:hypothetical protein
MELLYVNGIWLFLLNLCGKKLKRVAKDNSAIALFGSEPFSSHLRLSNINLFKYDWYWNKKIPSGMGLAKYQPMRQIEVVSIFSKTNFLLSTKNFKR